MLCIAPVVVRATANETTMKKYTSFAGRFDGHGDAPVCYRAHCPMEEVQSFTRSHWTPPSAIGQVFAPIAVKGHTYASFLCCFSSSTRRKLVQSKRIVPNKNRGMTYQTDGKHLSKTVEYLVWGVNIAFKRLINIKFYLR